MYRVTVECPDPNVTIILKKEGKELTHIPTEEEVVGSLQEIMDEMNDQDRVDEDGVMLHNATGIPKGQLIPSKVLRELMVTGTTRQKTMATNALTERMDNTCECGQKFGHYNALKKHKRLVCGLKNQTGWKKKNLQEQVNEQHDSV